MADIPRLAQPYANMSPVISYDWTKKETTVPKGTNVSKVSRAALAMQGLKGAATPR